MRDVSQGRHLCIRIGAARRSRAAAVARRVARRCGLQRRTRTRSRPAWCPCAAYRSCAGARCRLHACGDRGGICAAQALQCGQHALRLAAQQRGLCPTPTHLRTSEQ